MTNEEYNKIYELNGMAYKMRDEFISPEQQQALNDYHTWRKRGVEWKAHRADTEYREFRKRDEITALHHVQGNCLDDCVACSW